MSNSTNNDQRFENFVFMQAQSAGLFLGQLPHPSTGQRSVNLQAAQSVLDSLEMLAEKSKGNLTETEDKLLTKAVENIKNLYSEAQDLT